MLEMLSSRPDHAHHLLKMVTFPKLLGCKLHAVNVLAGQADSQADDVLLLAIAGVELYNLPLSYPHCWSVTVPMAFFRLRPISLSHLPADRPTFAAGPGNAVGTRRAQHLDRRSYHVGP